MNDKKPTHIVNHDSLYLSIGGKLQHVPRGTQVALNREQEKSVKRFVTAIKETKAVEVDEAKKQGNK